MSTEASRALVHRLFDEVINRWNFAVLDQIFAPIFRVAPDEGRPARGAEDARQFFQWLPIVYSDLNYTINDVVVEGELAVARCTHGALIAESGTVTARQACRWNTRR